MIAVKKFVTIKNQLKAQNGAFSFFGLFLREDALDKWDVIVAAPWAEADKQAALETISAATTSALAPSELLLLSRVVILEHDKPMLQAIWAAFQSKDRVAQFVNATVSGLLARRAYILESQPTAAEAAGAGAR